jgi:hypothetical protein
MMDKIESCQAEEKRMLDRILRTIIGVLVIGAVLQPQDSDAEMLEIWARGHGSFLMGPESLSFFNENDAGLGYGFALGVEVIQVDVFGDLTFHPDGSMFNVAGLGFDIDVVPVDIVSLEPKVNAVYFFGRYADFANTNEYQRGFAGQLGLALEVELFPFCYFGIEGLGSYLFHLSESENGIMGEGNAYLTFRFDVI